jgi:ATP-dependent Clp protease ATP-binding subunit ClpA
MTTNAGAEIMARPSIGFTQQDHSTDAMETIKKTFTPEFRNRLDAIVQFKSLDPTTIFHVVDKFLYELENQLAEKKVVMHVDDEARQWLAEHGYDEKMGARPMARVIKENIKKPLAEELLFGQLANGGNVEVTVEDGKIKFEFENIPEIVRS